MDGQGAALRRLGWWPFVWPALAVAGLTFICIGPWLPPATSLSSRTLPCHAAPAFQVGYADELNSVVLTGPRSVTFESLSWVYTTLCQASTITLEGDGQGALGMAPELTVGLDGKTLTILPFKGRTSARVFVPGPGRLTLGFFNDYYRADIRIAFLERLRFSGVSCQGWRSVTVPPSSGGQWRPDIMKATLVYAVPITLVPCGPGTLNVQASGRQGGGAFPVLRVSQQGKTLKIMRTSAVPVPLSLPVSGDPVDIVVTNPFGRTLADRRIVVSKIGTEQAPAH